MSTPKVSIVVPIYNAVKYLEECLNALVNQTLKEIEIILVLDCPTDGSDLIAGKFQEKDKRIKIVRNEVNVHLGMTRNAGMQQITGEYVGFCDADDYCSLNMYELLYTKAKEENAEVARCNHIQFNEEKRIEYKFPELPLEKARHISIAEIMKQRSMSGTVWNHIFKTDFLKKHNLSFIDTKMMIAEDRMFLYQVYLKANRLVLVPDALYYYRTHLESIVHSLDFFRLNKVILSFENLKLWLLEENIYEKYRDSYLEGFLRNIYTSFRRYRRQFSLNQAFKEISTIKESQMMVENINQILKLKNFFYFLRVKPMAIILLLVIKYT